MLFTRRQKVLHSDLHQIKKVLSLRNEVIYVYREVHEVTTLNPKDKQRRIMASAKQKDIVFEHRKFNKLPRIHNK